MLCGSNFTVGSNPTLSVMIKNLFPIPIYHTHIDCPEPIRDKMMQYCEDFHNEYHDELEEYGGLTGDQADPEYFLLHHKEDFYWLTDKVSRAVKEYLHHLCGDELEYNIFVQKAWTTVCRYIDGVTSFHYHKGSHFSVVYYLRTEGDGGSLMFCNKNLIDELPVLPKDEMQQVDIDVEDGDLIVFPSSIMHGVSLFNGESYRASIVYDVFVTSNQNVDDRYENVVTCPSKWVQI